jgi:hypothetical protein
LKAFLKKKCEEKKYRDCTFERSCALSANRIAVETQFRQTRVLAANQAHSSRDNAPKKFSL